MCSKKQRGLRSGQSEENEYKFVMQVVVEVGKGGRVVANYSKTKVLEWGVCVPAG